MKIPTWVTLRQVADEFRGISQQIAEGIGELLPVDITTKDIDDPRFCLALNSRLGWEPSVTLYKKKN